MSYCTNFAWLVSHVGGMRGGRWHTHRAHAQAHTHGTHVQTHTNTPHNTHTAHAPSPQLLASPDWPQPVACVAARSGERACTACAVLRRACAPRRQQAKMRVCMQMRAHAFDEHHRGRVHLRMRCQGHVAFMPCTHNRAGCSRRPALLVAAMRGGCATARTHGRSAAATDHSADQNPNDRVPR